MKSCRDVATLASDAPGGRIPLWRVNVHMHLLLCRHCRRFARQMRQLGMASRQCRDSMEPEGSDGEFEERLTSKLTSKLTGD